ncbi:MAG: APC family permease [Chloroflexi bacterium]|nr:APC family permease [Chloroflexota bacterium]MBI3760736.1 APC family permease [Chloroflexota bacterium]
MAVRIEGRPWTLTKLLLGDPLSTADIPHQTIGKLVGLAVFASDALSSTAYATEEILFVLVLAGMGVLPLSLPIAVGIAVLLALVTISYEQTIHAYPNGGGAYIVARDNLGEYPAQVAGAALLTDYILTVSVSISSGVAQITSAFPALYGYRVAIAVSLVVLMTIVNLRGVKESGRAFAVPTYFFIAMMVLTLGRGFYLQFIGSLPRIIGVEPIPVADVQALTLFLILRAFSSGSAALTGIEAISNGIPAFKEPRSRNAGLTLIWMSAILTTMFLGITFLARQAGALPSHTETVISQLARAIHGGSGLLYLGTVGATTVILIMAANTSFADFPRLGAIQAADGFLPKQLTFRGSRLVYSYGIITLAFFASMLIIIFGAKTNALIPLYAIGVFLSFTLSQAGMAVRFGRIGKLKPGQVAETRSSTLYSDPRWRVKQTLSAFGAVVTFVVMIVFAVTKFAQGAWIVVLVIPTLVFVFFRIHHHYRDVAAQLSLDEFGGLPRVRRHRVIVPISGVHRGVVIALRYARALSDDVTALYVSLDPAETEKVKQKWERWGDGVRLKVVESPYRTLVEKILDYVEQVQAERQPHEVLTIVVPHFIPQHRWYDLLHAQTARWLRWALLGRKDVVVTDVPYHLTD